MESIIKQLREKHSYSQEELALKLGVSRQTYIKYETGAVEMPIEPEYDIQKSEKKTESPDIRISIPENNIEKFKQVFLYILSKVGAKPNVRQTVLYKLLYFF